MRRPSPEALLASVCVVATAAYVVLRRRHTDRRHVLPTAEGGRLSELSDTIAAYVSMLATCSVQWTDPGMPIER
ncbi:hypothetical protein ACH492_33250 [Streptomyces sp. NPDC019443]|uniref:hypothetical protein n=1 Tax=Streptomyces sp. NPDC019443 TaxID=3365061 RepID=UPI0037A18306